MRHKIVDLDVVVVVAIAAFGLAYLLPWPSVWGALFAAVLAVAAAYLVPQAIAPDRIGPLARGVLTGASLICTAVLAALLLNLLPTGLSRANLLLSLLGIVVVAAYIVGRWRGGGRPLPQPTVPAAPKSESLAMIAGAFALVVAAVGVSIASKDAADTQQFVALSMVPAQAGSATVEVRNDMASVQSFTLLVNSGAQPTNYRFALVPGDTWTRTVPADKNAGAALFLGEPAGTPYRTVWLGKS